MSVGLKRFLYVLLVIVLMGGAFAGGYFIKDLINKPDETYVYDHAEIVWLEDLTDEEKETFLEGSTEQELIDYYNKTYATTKFVFKSGNTVEFNIGGNTAEPTTADYVEIKDSDTIRVYSGSNGYFNLVWRDGKLCVDVLSTITTDVTSLNIYIVLLKA